MANAIRFLVDENDEGSERIIDVVDQYGTITVHRFRHFRRDGQEVWLSIPGCCSDDAHALLS